MNIDRIVRTAAVLLLAAALAVPSGLASQTRGTQPPEYKELVAAFNTADAAARLQELERIKAAFPGSQFMEAIDSAIVGAKVELAATLDAVLALQKDHAAKAKGPARFQAPVAMSVQILDHPRNASFDRAGVLAAVLRYRDEAIAAAGDPASLEGLPERQRDFMKAQALNAVELLAARAHLNNGDAAKAGAFLGSYKTAGGQTGGNYQYVLAGVKELTGRTEEAYEAYLAAAVEGFMDSAARAKALHAKIHGRPDGFEAALAAKSKALPFHPAPFKAPADGKGKVVLAELFTGSECPPCVAADLAFDGLVEVFPAKYLAVLVYHLPIPRPDPMMNPATGARQAFYGVNSTPTVFFDGVRNATGGGNRGMAERKFDEYRAAVEPPLSAMPAVVPAVRAALSGDKVVVSFDPDKALPEAVYQLVLVQDEQEHKGGNGLLHHKMVVRDILEVDPKGPGTAAFDLAASEKAADAYLSEFEKTYTRVPGFKWEVRRHALPRRGLKVVFFVQDRESKKVLNAAVADVE